MQERHTANPSEVTRESDLQL